jgi:hypothetical protein
LRSTQRATRSAELTTEAFRSEVNGFLPSEQASFGGDLTSI